MENLLFSLNATMPIFLTMILGWIFRRIGLMDESFTDKMNKFVFQAALPVLVFCDLAAVDFFAVWDTKFVVFCFLVTALSITAVTLFSYVWKDRSVQGEFIQASYRSSAALLGIAFIQNIYGNSGMAPLMIVASVPLYNIMAVVVLTLFQPQSSTLENGSGHSSLQVEHQEAVSSGYSGSSPDRQIRCSESSQREEKHGASVKMNRALAVSTLKGIITNPIILGIAAGFLWSILKLPMPVILEKTLNNIGKLASPLGLMAMGAAFEWKQVGGKMKPAATAALIKLVLLAVIFLPIAVMLGFRQEKLIAILVMLGSATTVSCYIMARNMGHDGVMTSGTVMLTTLGSAFTLTGWLYLLKTMSLI